VKTDADYAVEIRRLAVEVEALHLDLSTGEDSAGFDPAHPPEGYSLCHNGHCHGPGGSLVPYDEIQRQVSGASSFSVARFGMEQPVELGPEPIEIALGECTSECELERGEITEVGVDLHGIDLEVIVFDPRTESRLPPGGAAFSAELVLEAEVGAELDGRVDDGEPLVVRVAADLAMPESMFDGIDWAAVSTAAAALDSLKVNLEESDALTAHLERYDP
jgi:hypothetical protein